MTGETSVPRRSSVSSPARKPRLTHGSGSGSQARPTCGIWMRWSIRAIPAKPTSAAARARSASQRPGLSPQANVDTCKITGNSTTGERGWVRHRRGFGPRRGVLTDADHAVPALRGERSLDLDQLAQLGRQDGRRHRPVPLRVAFPAERRRGVEDHHDRRQAGRSGLREVGLPPICVESQRVHHGGQPPADPRCDDLFQQGEGVAGGVQIGGAAAHDRPQRVRGDDLSRAVSLRRPTPTYRLRPPRPAPPPPDPEAGRSACEQSDSQRPSAESDQ